MCRVNECRQDGRTSHIKLSHKNPEPSFLLGTCGSGSLSSAGHEAIEMVDHRFGPPAACWRRPDVCHRQMMGKRSCGWRALGNEQENERRDCLRPLVLTGLPFSGICSITAVCVEAPLNGPTDSRDTQRGKQAFSLWPRSANCAQNSRRLNVGHETIERFGVNDVGVTL